MHVFVSPLGIKGRRMDLFVCVSVCVAPTDEESVGVNNSEQCTEKST